MPWITEADLQTYAGDQWLKLVDIDNDGSADAGVGQAAVDKANAYVTDTLSSKFSALPASSTTLKQVALQLGLYFLHRKEKPKHVIEGRTDALDTLQRIVDGKLAIADLAVDVGVTHYDFDETDPLKPTEPAWYTT